MTSERKENETVQNIEEAKKKRNKKRKNKKKTAVHTP